MKQSAEQKNKLAGQSTAIIENNSDLHVPLTSLDEESIINDKLLKMLDLVKREAPL